MSMSANKWLRKSLPLLGRSNGSTEPSAILSDRELELFQYISEGLTHKEITTQMHLSPCIQDSYRADVKEQMDLYDRHIMVRNTVRWKDRLR